MGIGKTTAASFLKRGDKVVITGRNQARLEAARKSLAPLGEVIAVPGDVSRREDMEQLVASSLAAFGRIDVLVCNAGIKFEDRLTQTTAETLEKIISVNTLGVLYLIKAAIPALASSSGSVVLISSLAGLYGLPGSVVYSASKMALTAIQQSLALELGPQGIHVGILYVGFTENDALSGLMNGAGEKVPFPDRGIGRQPQTAVAAAIIRMASQKRSRLVLTFLGKVMYLIHRIWPGALYILLRQREKKQINSKSHETTSYNRAPVGAHPAAK